MSHNHRFGAGPPKRGPGYIARYDWLNLEPALTCRCSRRTSTCPCQTTIRPGVTVSFVVTNAGFRVEQVALTVTLPHPNYGDLAITLISPGGTVSGWPSAIIPQARVTMAGH